MVAIIDKECLALDVIACEDCPLLLCMYDFENHAVGKTPPKKKRAQHGATDDDDDDWRREAGRLDKASATGGVGVEIVQFLQI